jgi:hypothetical protein
MKMKMNINSKEKESKRSEELDEIFRRIEAWSGGIRRKQRTALAMFRDRETQIESIRYEGTTLDIANCVLSIMEDDRELGDAIFGAATLYGYRYLTPEYVHEMQVRAEALVKLRAAGASNRDIKRAMRELDE